MRAPRTRSGALGPHERPRGGRGVAPSNVLLRNSSAGRLDETVAAPNFYRESADTIKVTLARQEQLRAELEESYARWEVLEARRGSFRG